MAFFRYPKHTALTLRLTKNWHGTGRIVYGDSYFASVQTARGLLDRGTDFIGMVKTCSAGFCKKHLHTTAWAEGKLPAERGDTRHVEAEIMVDNVKRKIYGHAWNEPGSDDAPKKVLVSTCSTSLPADPHVKKRFKVNADNNKFTEVVYRTVPRPQVVKQYFEAACQIDIHNHLRQGVLAIEDHVGTKDPLFRLFTTIFGMSVVDAYKVYNMENKIVEKEDLQSFISAASVSLLTNEKPGCRDMDVHVYQLRARNKRVEDVEEPQTPVSHDPYLHAIISVSDYKFMGEQGQNDRHALHGCCVRCQVDGCGNNAYMCCIKCSDAQGKPWGVCGPKTKRCCAQIHQKKMMLQPGPK